MSDRHDSCAATRSQKEQEIMDRRQPHVGDVVIFTDPEGVDQNALVLAVHGDVKLNGCMPCINAVRVARDKSKQDPYGRQTEKGHTSIVHVSVQPAHGLYWRWPGEEKKPIQEPTEV